MAARRSSRPQPITKEEIRAQSRHLMLLALVTVIGALLVVWFIGPHGGGPPVPVPINLPPGWGQ